jgi:hypothetical protein
MNFKPDNKCGDSEDITLVFETITNFRYWQVKHAAGENWQLFRMPTNFRS